ncbi:MAG: replicative DNA helicase [bacterium]|nr:replicative DNA helicase [bacterium]
MSVFDQPLPHDSDSERALIGAVLLDPWRYADISESITPGSFYGAHHALIWGVLEPLCAAGGQIDLLTLCDALDSGGRLEEVGGRSGVAELLASVPTGANAGRYAAIVSEHHTRRMAIAASVMLQEQAFDGSPVAAMLDAAAAELSRLQQGAADADGNCSVMADLMPGVIEHLEALQAGDERVLGLTTGFPDLDKKVRLRPGEMIVLAARPSIGKSALMWCMSAAQATAAIPIGIFSYEMSKESLANRALFAEAGVNAIDVRDGALSPGCWDGLMDSARRLATKNIRIDDRKGTILQLRARARRMVQKHGVRIIYIDYLQLIPEGSGGKRNRNRENAVAELSGSVKSLAQELEIPVVILAQLNRAAEQDVKNETLANTRPKLKHLRESGAIEQDADVVLLLHRLRCDGVADAEVLIPKQRNGPTGLVTLQWQPQYTRFVSASKVADADVPQYAREPVPGTAEDMQRQRALEPEI